MFSVHNYLKLQLWEIIHSQGSDKGHKSKDSITIRPEPVRFDGALSTQCNAALEAHHLTIIQLSSLVSDLCIRTCHSFGQVPWLQMLHVMKHFSYSL